MPALSTISFFLLAALGLLLLPGPAVLYIITHSVVQGERAGLASVLGIELASLTHAVEASLGLSALLMTSAFALSVVKYLRASYLIYLGVRTLLSWPGKSASRYQYRFPRASLSCLPRASW